MLITKCLIFAIRTVQKGHLLDSFCNQGAEINEIGTLSRSTLEHKWAPRYFFGRQHWLEDIDIIYCSLTCMVNKTNKIKTFCKMNEKHRENDKVF